LELLEKHLDRHGVPEADIPLYSYLIFPRGDGLTNVMPYLKMLVEKKLAPLRVLAAYSDLLGSIEAFAAAGREEGIYNAFANSDYKQAVPLIAAATVTEITATNLLVAESDTGVITPARVRELQIAQKKEDAQLKVRQYPFREWLKVFDLALGGTGDNSLGGWGEALALLDQEQAERQQKRTEFGENVKDQADATWQDGSTSTQQKLQKSLETMLEVLEAPTSLDGAYYQRLWKCVLCFSLSLFVVLAHAVFGDATGETSEVTLAAFLGVQASLAAFFFRNIPIEEFQRQTLDSAFAYCVSRFRTGYDYDFHEQERIQEKSNCNNPCFHCFNRCLSCWNGELDDIKSGYFKWKAMALFKMRKNYANKQAQAPPKKQALGIFGQFVKHPHMK